MCRPISVNLDFFLIEIFFWKSTLFETSIKIYSQNYKFTKKRSLPFQNYILYNYDLKKKDERAYMAPNTSCIFQFNLFFSIIHYSKQEIMIDCFFFLNQASQRRKQPVAV